jgi:hypothetical protein
VVVDAVREAGRHQARVLEWWAAGREGFGAGIRGRAGLRRRGRGAAEGAPFWR